MPFFDACEQAKKTGPEDRGSGEGGIRTLDRVAPIQHFQCCAFDHSATSPAADVGQMPM